VTFITQSSPFLDGKIYFPLSVFARESLAACITTADGHVTREQRGEHVKPITTSRKIADSGLTNILSAKGKGSITVCSGLPNNPSKIFCILKRL